MSSVKANKKAKKASRDNVTIPPLSLDLRSITPMTNNQSKTFRLYGDGMNILLHGYAGTGKTFCALYLALKELLSGKSSFHRIVLVRSVVPSRDMGFLPGSASDKAAIYEEPYKDICTELFGRGDAYRILRDRGIISFTTSSFLRGTTFKDAIVIVDEIQNFTFPEIDTTMTRLGDNSRVLFCGDFRQTDLKSGEARGIHKFMSILEAIPSFGMVEFTEEDIVRSGLVKEYIMARTDYEDEVNGAK